MFNNNNHGALDIILYLIKYCHVIKEIHFYSSSYILKQTLVGKGNLIMKSPGRHVNDSALDIHIIVYVAAYLKSVYSSVYTPARVDGPNE